MFTVNARCPYCSDLHDFHIFGVSAYKKIGMKTERISNIEVKQREEWEKKNPTITFFAAALCPQCNNAVTLEIEGRISLYNEIIECLKNPSFIPKLKEFTLLSVSPKPEEPYTHPSLPDKVNKNFFALQNIIKQSDAPPIVISGCRSVLEAAVRDLDPEGTGSLNARIRALKNKNIISGVLFDWATHVRMEGNEAAHEMAGTQQEAAEIVEFTKLFLQYTYEFPDTIRRKRQNTKS
jgi:Zn ribbon nucleic-acid-binding protein